MAETSAAPSIVCVATIFAAFFSYCVVNMDDIRVWFAQTRKLLQIHKFREFAIRSGLTNYNQDKSQLSF